MLPDRLGCIKMSEILGIFYRMAFSDRQAVRIPKIYNSPVILYPFFIELCFMTDLKGCETVDTELLMYHKEGIHQLHFFRIIHIMELFGLRQAIGKMFSDTDNRSFINTVNIKRNAIGFLDIQRRQNSLFTGHGISFFGAEYAEF